MSDPSPPAANLLEEPWIPVIPREGPPRDVGLHELLLHAGSFKGLNETAPPSLVALHRMLLALVHRALTLHHGPWKDADRKRWLRDGLPTKPLEAYLDQWQHRFWLFHPEFPFMQVPALATAVETKDKVKPWTQIALHAATGNTPTLFDHTMDGTPDAVPWPVVLRALLGFLQFTPGGLIKCFRSSDKAGPLANTAAVLLGGSTLGEGWLLGLHPYEAQNPHDLPAWERTPPTAKVLADEATVPSGINDRYTRLTRAVLLLPEADGRVGGIRFGAGLALGEDANALDPMACHRLNAEGKPIRITFTEGRATWRDLPALLPDASGKASLPPQVLAWATAIREEAASDVAVAGLASDQAKLLRWRTERFHLPMSLLTNPQQAQELRLLLSQTEEGYRKVRDLTTDLSARSLPSPDHKDSKARARAMADASPAAATYFSALERALPQLLAHLGDMDEDAAGAHWQAAQLQATQDAWSACVATLGRSPAALRAEALVRPRFLALIRSLQPEAKETPCHE